NGIYVVSQDLMNDYFLARAPDADGTAKLLVGMFATAQYGSQAGRRFVVRSVGRIDADRIAFARLALAGDFDAPPLPWALWGVADETTMVTLLAGGPNGLSVSDFLRRGGLDYAELTDLLSSRFVNAGG